MVAALIGLVGAAVSSIGGSRAKQGVFFNYIFMFSKFPTMALLNFSIQKKFSPSMLF